MDAGSFGSSFSSSTEKTQSRFRQPLAKVGSTVYIPSLRSFSSNPPSYKPSGDRFIPNRSAMDFDVAHYLLTQPRRENENAGVVSPAKEAYRKLLAETLLNNRTRILAFNNKPPSPAEGMLHAISEATASNQSKISKSKRYIPQYIGCAGSRGRLLSEFA